MKTEKIDELIRLKAEEEPPKKYWNNYWPRLKNRIKKTSAISQLNPHLPRNRNLFDLFIPRFGLVLNGLVVIMLIFAGSFLYKNTQQMELMQIAFNKRQEKPAGFETKQAVEKSVRKQVKLFQEIRKTFSHNVKWIVTNNGDIDVELASRKLEKAVSQEQVPIFLKFEILRLGPAAEIVSSPKIMVLNGNEVNTNLKGSSTKDNTSYRYQFVPIVNTNGSVDLMAKVSLDDSALTGSLKLVEGKTVKLGSIRKENDEYSVYVTVCFKDFNVVKTESKEV